MKEKRFDATDFVLLAVSVLLFVGILTFFKPCGPTEEGKWMNCHWAGQTVTVLAAALLALGVLRLPVRPAVRIGIDIAVIVISAAAIFVPGRLIPLCMMPQMRCRADMTPCVTVLSVLTIIAAAVDLVLKTRKKKHET